MKDRDDKLLEETYNQVNEDWRDQWSATKGSRLAGLGYKAAGAIGNRVGGEAGKFARGFAKRGMKEVSEQRAEQILTIYKGKIEKLLAELDKDANAIGANLNDVQQGMRLKKGQTGPNALLSLFNLKNSLQDGLQKANVAIGAQQSMNNPQQTS